MIGHFFYQNSLKVLRINTTYPLCSEVSILGLLLAGVGPVHGVVLLELHGLHLLLDGVHCGAVVGVESGKRSETEILFEILIHNYFMNSILPRYL